MFTQGDIVYNKLLLGNTQVLDVKNGLPVLRNTEKVHSHPSWLELVELNPNNTVVLSKDPFSVQNRKGEIIEVKKGSTVYDKLTNCVCDVKEITTSNLIIESYFRYGVREFYEVEAFDIRYVNNPLDYWVVKSKVDTENTTIKVKPGNTVYDVLTKQNTKLIKLYGSYAGTSVVLVLEGNVARQPWQVQGI